MVRRWWESLTLPVHNLGQCRLSWWVCCLLWSTELSDMWSWGFRQSNCLDRIWHYRRQEPSVIPRDCEKRLHGSSDLFRSQETERILLCETKNSCWQWIQSKHHERVPKRGSYYLVNNSVRSRNHTMSVTLNLGAVGIIWPACKPVHILYLKPLHSRVRSQSALIKSSNYQMMIT